MKSSNLYKKGVGGYKVKNKIQSFMCQNKKFDKSMYCSQENNKNNNNKKRIPYMIQKMVGYAILIFFRNLQKLYAIQYNSMYREKRLNVKFILGLKLHNSVYSIL